MNATFGALREAQDRLGDAAKEYLEGERLLRELSEKDPDVVYWRMSHVTSRNALGRLLQKVGEGLDDAEQKIQFLSQAVTQFVAARNSLSELVERDQNNSAWQCSLAWTERLLGGAINVPRRFHRSRTERTARPLSRRPARARAERLRIGRNRPQEAGGERSAERGGTRRDYSVTAARAANVLEKMGKREDALIACRAALSASEFLMAVDPTNTRWSEDVSSLKETIARLETSSSDEGPPTAPAPPV